MMTADMHLLRAERDCRAVIMAYGRALDWADEAALAKVFWPDAEIDFGFYRGDAAGFIPVVIGLERSALRRFHLTAGEVISVSGAEAVAESLGVTQAVSEGPNGLVSSVFYGRYLDRLQQRQGAWRISARRYLLHGATSGPYQDPAALAGLPTADNLSPEHTLFRQM